MSAHDSIGRGEFEALARQVRAPSTQSPLGNSAITSGALRVASAEGLIVQGSALVIGLLDGTGTFHWAGPMTIDGITQFNGPLGLDGPAFLRDSLTVESGGSITAGLLRIDETDAGRISHPVLIALSAPATAVNNLAVLANAEIDGEVTLRGLPTMSRTSVTPNLPVGALWANPSGRVFRAV